MISDKTDDAQVGSAGSYVRGRHKQGEFAAIDGTSILTSKRYQEGKRELLGRCFALNIFAMIRVATPHLSLGPAELAWNNLLCISRQSSSSGGILDRHLPG
jgi:hypothetical protein